MAPAFYAAGTGGWRDWWLVLHPPYTAWHLSYVVIGACLAPVVDTHAAARHPARVLLRGRDRRARPRRAERATAATPILRLARSSRRRRSASGSPWALARPASAETGWVLVPFIVVGPLIVVAYNAELFGGIVHNDVGFAVAWGAFPVLTAYVAQAETLELAPVLAAYRGLLAVGGPTTPQHSGESPAPPERARRGHGVRPRTVRCYDRPAPILLAPLEGALRALCWSTVLLRDLARSATAELSLRPVAASVEEPERAVRTVEEVVRVDAHDLFEHGRVDAADVCRVDEVAVFVESPQALHLPVEPALD